MVPVQEMNGVWFTYAGIMGNTTMDYFICFKEKGRGAVRLEIAKRLESKHLLLESTLEEDIVQAGLESVTTEMRW